MTYVATIWQPCTRRGKPGRREIVRTFDVPTLRAAEHAAVSSLRAGETLAAIRVEGGYPSWTYTDHLSGYRRYSR